MYRALPDSDIKQVEVPPICEILNPARYTRASRRILNDD